MEDRLVTGVEEIVRGVIPPEMYKKYRKKLDKYHADLEGNVREFLSHLGVEKAIDLDEPLENISKRMELLDLHVIHVTVKRQPDLTGVWVMKGNKPLVSFSAPRLKDGKIELTRTILDKSVLVVT